MEGEAACSQAFNGFNPISVTKTRAILTRNRVCSSLGTSLRPLFQFNFRILLESFSQNKMLKVSQFRITHLKSLDLVEQHSKNQTCY